MKQFLLPNLAYRGISLAKYIGYTHSIFFSQFFSNYLWEHLTEVSLTTQIVSLGAGHFSVMHLINCIMYLSLLALPDTYNYLNETNHCRVRYYYYKVVYHESEKKERKLKINIQPFCSLSCSTIRVSIMVVLCNDGTILQCTTIR